VGKLELNLHFQQGVTAVIDAFVWFQRELGIRGSVNQRRW
jgi:hypothetical protein